MSLVDSHTFSAGRRTVLVAHCVKGLDGGCDTWFLASRADLWAPARPTPPPDKLRESIEEPPEVTPPPVPPPRHRPATDPVQSRHDMGIGGFG